MPTILAPVPSTSNDELSANTEPVISIFGSTLIVIVLVNGTVVIPIPYPLTIVSVSVLLEAVIKLAPGTDKFLNVNKADAGEVLLRVAIFVVGSTVKLRPVTTAMPLIPLLVIVIFPVLPLTSMPEPAVILVTPVLVIVTAPVDPDTLIAALPTKLVTPVLVNVIVSVDASVVNDIAVPAANDSVSV